MKTHGNVSVHLGNMGIYVNIMVTTISKMLILLNAKMNIMASYVSFHMNVRVGVTLE